MTFIASKLPHPVISLALFQSLTLSWNLCCALWDLSQTSSKHPVTSTLLWGFTALPKEREKQKQKSLSHVRLFATPWTVADQAPPSMGFSRQEYCSGLPFPSPGLPFLVQQITGSPQRQAAPQIPSRSGYFLPPPQEKSSWVFTSTPVYPS